MVDANGNVSPEWYRYFSAIHKTIGGPSNPLDDASLLVPPAGTAALQGAGDGRYVRQDQTPAWADPTGTLDRTTFASASSFTVSNPPTQAEVQAIAAHVVLLSERLAALLTDLRANSALT